MSKNNISNNYKQAVNSSIISGNWFRNNDPYFMPLAGSTVNASTGSLYFKPFFSANAATYTNIAMNVTALGAGSNLNMGIYASNASMTQPDGNALPNSTSGSISSATNGVKSFTFSSPITLNQGIYWLAFSVSATVGFSGQSTAGTCDGFATFGTLAPSTTDNASIPGWLQTFVYNATLPSVGSLTATAVTAGDPGTIFMFLKAQ